MKKTYVEKRIKRIETKLEDWEEAHFQRDRLWELVLRAIAKGAENAQELAQAALKVLELDIAYFYA